MVDDQEEEYIKEEKEFWKKSTLRYLSIKKALLKNDINVLYATLHRFLDDGYSKYVERYFVNDCAIFLCEWGTTGLCVHSTNDGEDYALQYISLELSKAIYELNNWWQTLGHLYDHIITYDDNIYKSKHDIIEECKLDRESDLLLLVQERLAEQLKKEIPDCRVFIFMREIEFITDEKGNIVLDP